jgi:hypothetical protein
VPPARCTRDQADRPDRVTFNQSSTGSSVGDGQFVEDVVDEVVG